MPNELLKPSWSARFARAFWNVNGDRANAIRAQLIISSTFAHTALGVVAVVSLPSADIKQRFVSLMALGAVVVFRFVWCALYQPGNETKEKVWAAGFSFLTIGTAACWASLTVQQLLSHGLLDQPSVLLLIMCSGIAASGAATLPPDRAVARSYLAALLLP